MITVIIILCPFFFPSNLILMSPESGHLSKWSLSRAVLTRGKLDSYVCHMRPSMGTKYT